jgi:hypothetical protein
MIVLGISKEMEDGWEYSWFVFREQHDWVKTCLDPDIIGLDKFKLISVRLLNIEAVIELVDGVENEEMEDFVINLTRCKCCKEIALVRHDELKNCSVVTIFDENNKNEVAYSKKAIRDLSVSKGKDKKSRFIFEVKCDY